MRVIGETPSKFRITAIERTKLAGRNRWIATGETALVPKPAIRLDLPMTPSLRRGLEIIRDNPGLRPARFAELMWPNSPGWDRVVKCGHGSHRGGGMYQAGGGLLGKYSRAGYVILDRNRGYSLSSAGRKVLEQP